MIQKSLVQSIDTPLKDMPSKNENDILKIVGVAMFEMVLGGLKYRLSAKGGIQGPNPFIFVGNFNQLH